MIVVCIVFLYKEEGKKKNKVRVYVAAINMFLKNTVLFEK